MVVIGGIIGIVFCIVDKTCGSNEQARITIILFIDGKLIALYDINYIPFYSKNNPHSK